jgi:predicted MFS family arabinose efflux permease
MSTQAENSAQKIKETPLSWVVWGLGCLFYFYEFLLQVSPNPMSKQLMEDFHVSAQALGMLSGAYFYSYAGMQIPAGVFLDKFGPHKLLTFATFICALSSIAFGTTHSLLTAEIARFCIGFGSAFAVIGTMKFAANWFPPQRFALLTGLMVAIGMSGAIGGEAPLARFINAFGWRESMIYLGIAGLVLTGLIYFIAQDQPKGGKTNQKDRSQLPLLQGLKQVIRIPQIWLVAIYGGLMYAPTPVLCGLWGGPFLEQRFHLNNVDSSSMISYIFFGWIVGSPTWGYISDKIQRRKLPMWIGTIGALLTLYVIIYSSINDLTTIKALLFFFGLFSCGFLTAFSVAKEISCNNYTATAMSFMQTMNMVGVALAQPLIGYILDKLWLGKVDANGVHLYTTAHYQTAISLLPIGVLIALIILPFIKETHCQEKE